MGLNDDLVTVNARFYTALETLDLGAMDEVWATEAPVRCVHPGWEMLVGWQTVRKSFEQIFSSTRWIRVTPTAITTDVFGDIGIVTCMENITSADEGDVGLAVAQATNLYRLTEAGWRMIHHHSSPAPVTVTHEFDGTLQ